MYIDYLAFCTAIIGIVHSVYYILVGKLPRFKGSVILMLFCYYAILSADWISTSTPLPAWAVWEFCILIFLHNELLRGVKC